MCPVPDSTLLEETIDRIIDQVFRVNIGVDVAFVASLQEPADVRIKEAETRRMGIEFCVVVTMMGSVNRRPPYRRTFKGKVAGQD